MRHPFDRYTSTQTLHAWNVYLGHATDVGLPSSPRQDISGQDTQTGCSRHLVPFSSLLVTGALLVVTRFANRNKCLTKTSSIKKNLSRIVITSKGIYWDLLLGHHVRCYAPSLICSRCPWSVARHLRPKPRVRIGLGDLPSKSGEPVQPTEVGQNPSSAILWVPQICRVLFYGPSTSVGTVDSRDWIPTRSGPAKAKQCKTPSIFQGSSSEAESLGSRNQCGLR